MAENKTRREFLKSGVVAAGLGCLSLASRIETSVSALPREDRPNTHNIMLVGERTAYLSHLPMFVREGAPSTFDSPHRFQVILEATFSDGSRDLTQDYFSDRAKNPSVKMYTLNPALFVLSRVNPAGVALKKFRGNTIFRGHLERNGEAFIGFKGDRPPPGGLFDINVKRVIHFHQFDPKATRSEHLEYLLFGKGGELFMAHFITKPNDFDQIISVKIANPPFTAAQLAQGVHVTFSTRPNTAVDRLKEKETLSEPVKSSSGSPRTLTVEAARELYFEEGELAVPPNFDPTAEETKAGFG
jgi:hypothetical protein